MTERGRNPAPGNAAKSGHKPAVKSKKKEVIKMKIYATEMRNNKVLDKKFIGEARLLKDGNGSACIISARKYNELKRKSFSAFKKAHKGGYSIILMTEDNRRCSFGGYPLEFGYVRFE